MISKIIKISYKFCFIGIIVSCGFQNQPVIASKEPLIRVLISKDKNLRIRSDKLIPLIINGQKFSNKKVKGLTLKKESNGATIFFDRNKQKIYNLQNKSKIEIKSFDGRGIWVGQKRYAGRINVFVSNSEIFVINILGIENYLSSVVGSEMQAKWPFEALKAQAIASRTYALKQKRNLLYDVDSTQKNQVYNGLESSTVKTASAVRSTRSLVMVHKNKLINALFHSSSGGMTENSEDVWNDKYPYLSSVKDFDQNNPELAWQKSFSTKELETLFPKIGGINRIVILNITDTGRVKNVKLFGDYASNEISGVNLRKRLSLKSTLVRFKFIEDKKANQNNNAHLSLHNIDTSEDKRLIHIVKPGDSLIDIAHRYNVSVSEIIAINSIKDPSLININQKLLLPRDSVDSLSPVEKILVASGYGSGHGVGLSQWGAKYMATKGAKAKEILKHFYKGVKIKPFKKYYL